MTREVPAAQQDSKLAHLNNAVLWF